MCDMTVLVDGNGHRMSDFVSFMSFELLFFLLILPLVGFLVILVIFTAQKLISLTVDLRTHIALLFRRRLMDRLLSWLWLSRHGLTEFLDGF